MRSLAWGSTNSAMVIGSYGEAKHNIGTAEPALNAETVRGEECLDVDFGWNYGIVPKTYPRGSNRAVKCRKS